MRFTPTDVTSTYAAIAALNANFDDIAALLEKCVFTDGTAPNSMEADLDFNHFRIKNLMDGVDSTDAVTLSQVLGLLGSPNPPANCVNVETISGVVTGVVSDAQRVINTTNINSVLATGKRIWLRAGIRIEIASSLFLASNSGIIGEMGGVRPTIYMPLSKFTNTNNTTVDGTWAVNTRYGSNAVGINMSGQIGSPYTAKTNIRLENFTLESDPSIGRYLRGIVGLNVTNSQIVEVEVKNFPTAIAICLASVKGVQIRWPYIHDFTDSTNWASLPQITGIEIDNDIVNSVSSSAVLIECPRIENLTVSGALLTNWGYQTDGINICNAGATGRIVAPLIDTVGEGIDCFGSDWCMSDVILKSCYNYGLKFIHGALRNKATNVTVYNPGLAAVGFFGSDVAATNTSYNCVMNLTVNSLDPSNNWPSNNAACVLITDNGATLRKPSENQVIGATLNMGNNGEYGWLDTSTGSNNFGDDIGFVTGGSSIKRVNVTGTGGSVRLKGTTTYITSLV